MVPSMRVSLIHRNFFTYLNDDDCFGIHFAAMFNRHAAAKFLGPSAFDVFRTSIRRGRKVMDMTVGS